MAQSSFFQKLLNFSKNRNANPIIFITGIENAILQNILEYAYIGEVTIEQEKLDKFFDVAQKLEITSIDKEKLIKDIKIDGPDNIIEEQVFADCTNEGMKEMKAKEEPMKIKNSNNGRSKDNNDLKQYIVKNQDENKWQCSFCGKKCNAYANMRTHVEMHIDGLSFPCSNCSLSFPTRNTLYNHRKNYCQKLFLNA